MVANGSLAQLIAASRLRRSPLLGRDVGDVLRERPTVAFDVLRVVPAIAIRLLGRLADDLRAGRPRLLEMGVEIVDVDVHLCGKSSALPRRPVLGSGIAHHHETIVSDRHLSVSDVPLSVRIPKPLTEAESPREPCQLSGNVLVEEVRSNRGHVYGKNRHSRSRPRPLRP